MDSIENVIKHIKEELRDDDPKHEGVPKYLVKKLLDEYEKDDVEDEIRKG